jgi:hypothetical protein
MAIRMHVKQFTLRSRRKKGPPRRYRNDRDPEGGSRHALTA